MIKQNSVRGPACAYAASQPDSADFQRPFQTRSDSEYTATSPSSYLLGVSGYWRVGLALAMACGVSNAVQVPPPRHRVLRRRRRRAAALPGPLALKVSRNRYAAGT